MIPNSMPIPGDIVGWDCSGIPTYALVKSIKDGIAVIDLTDAQGNYWHNIDQTIYQQYLDTQWDFIGSDSALDPYTKVWIQTHLTEAELADRLEQYNKLKLKN